MQHQQEFSEFEVRISTQNGVIADVKTRDPVTGGVVSEASFRGDDRAHLACVLTRIIWEGRTCAAALRAYRADLVPSFVAKEWHYVQRKGRGAEAALDAIGNVSCPHCVVGW